MKVFSPGSLPRTAGSNATRPGPPSETRTAVEVLGSHGQPLELLAAANAREFVLVAAQQEKAVKLPAVRHKENRGIVEIAEDKVLVTGL